MSVQVTQLEVVTAGSQPVIHPSKPLQQELLRLLAIAPFWNKELEWLQSRAAVQALLPKATSGPEFARLLWLIEELLYEDLLKGSGWGRRRGWFREQLEATRNVAQVRAPDVFRGNIHDGKIIKG